MKSLTLYSTDHCTLCDKALELLFSMPELRGAALRVVDVAADEGLTRRYGQRLPVLCLGDRELDAPFDRNGVLALLQAGGTRRIGTEREGE